MIIPTPGSTSSRAQQLHILTVGISMLRNFEREQKTRFTGTEAEIQRLDHFLAADPRAASAELNALAGRFGSLEAIPSDLEVALIHTNTASGRTTAGAIHRWLTDRGIRVSEIELDGIDSPAELSEDSRLRAQIAEQSLIQLRQKVAAYVAKIRSANPDVHVEFNATGGFKAEVATLYGLGRELNIPVYYLHESFRTVITLP